MALKTVARSSKDTVFMNSRPKNADIHWIGKHVSEYDLLIGALPCPRDLDGEQKVQS